MEPLEIKNADINSVDSEGNYSVNISSRFKQSIM